MKYSFEHVLNFVDTLKCLYDRYPNGCLCIEYQNKCKHNSQYPFCKLDIENTINNEDKKCKKNILVKEEAGINHDICFTLTKENFDLISDFLSNYIDDEYEIFDGSIAYYSRDGNLIFCAIDFIDDVMAPEVIIDNIDCIQKLNGQKGS